MPVEFTLPELGENVEKGDVVRVLVKVGDLIEREQSVVELETDKATIEVPSSVAGRVTDVRVKAGDKVKVGQVILTLDPDGQAPAESPRAGDAAPRPAGQAKPAGQAPPEKIEDNAPVGEMQQHVGETPRTDAADKAASVRESEQADGDKEPQASEASRGRRGRRCSARSGCPCRRRGSRAGRTHRGCTVAPRGRSARRNWT